MLWRGGVVVITTAQLHSTKPQRRFYAGLNLASSIPEIRDGEYLWQWFLLKVRINDFRRSTTPQKQFIIIIIIIKITMTYSFLFTRKLREYLFPKGVLIYQGKQFPGVLISWEIRTKE